MASNADRQEYDKALLQAGNSLYPEDRAKGRRRAEKALLAVLGERPPVKK